MADKHFPIRVRIRDLTKVIRWRCGRALPDDDAGREYLSTMLDHFASLSDGRKRSENFAEIWAPWIEADDLNKLIEASFQAPRRWTADDLGRSLNLTEDERHELGVTTVAPADLSLQERAELRRQRRAEAARARRAREREKKIIDGFNGGDRQSAREASSREASILNELAARPGWWTVAELKAAVAENPCWRDHRGRPPGSETLRRLINRELTVLINRGSIEGRFEATKWGQSARKVRLAGDRSNAWLRAVVPGTPGQAIVDN